VLKTVKFTWMFIGNKSHVYKILCPLQGF